MPLVSVKIPEATKAKVTQLAARRGLTAHAVMAQAIETAVESTERYDKFVDDAMQSLDGARRNGRVYDGNEFVVFLRAKAGGDTQAVKPRASLLADAARASAIADMV